MRTITKAQLEALHTGKKEFTIVYDVIDVYADDEKFSHQLMVYMTYRIVKSKFYYEDVRFKSTKKGRRSQEDKAKLERMFDRMVKRNSEVIDLYGYCYWE